MSKSKTNLDLYQISAYFAICLLIFMLGYAFGSLNVAGLKIHKKLVQEKESRIKTLKTIKKFMVKFRDACSLAFTSLIAGTASMMFHHFHHLIIEHRGWTFGYWTLIVRQVMDLKFGLGILLVGFLALNITKRLFTRLASKMDALIESRQSERQVAVEEFMQYIGPELSEAITQKILKDTYEKYKQLQETTQKLATENKELAASTDICKSQLKAYSDFRNNVGSFVWCGDCTKSLAFEEPPLPSPNSFTEKVFSFKDLQPQPLQSSNRKTRSDSKNIDNGMAPKCIDTEMTDKSQEELSDKNLLYPGVLKWRTMGHIPSNPPIKTATFCKQGCVSRYLLLYSKQSEDLNQKLRPARIINNFQLKTGFLGMIGQKLRLR